MKKYLFMYNPSNKRYGYYDNLNNWIEFTSGSYIELEYNDLILKSGIEHNGIDYYMTKYRNIMLKDMAEKSYVLVGK